MSAAAATPDGQEAVATTKGPDGSTIVREGQAEILFGKDQPVFYNPVQEFNRDMSVLMLRILLEQRAKEGLPDGLRIIEALSASGLRSMRYVKEVDNIQWSLANDLSAAALATIERNREHNKIAPEKIPTSKADAKFLLYKIRSEMVNVNKPSEKGPIDVIDLDPFGGAGDFLDGAIQLVRDGGLLMVTCTDAAVLCGNHCETCFARYGVMPPKNTAYCHELALRVLLTCMSVTAARYKRYIVPMVSMSADFYVRVFVRVYSGAAQCKDLASNMSTIYQCVACPHFELQPVGRKLQNGASITYQPGRAQVDTTCRHCGAGMQVGGPLWSQPIHNTDWIKSCLGHLEVLDKNAALSADKRPAGAKLPFGTADRMKATLRLMRDELQDVPFFYDLARVSATFHAHNPKLEMFRSAVMRLGYKISMWCVLAFTNVAASKSLTTASHTDQNTCKTTAPTGVIFDIMRLWFKNSAVELQRSTGKALADIDPDQALEEALAKLPPTSTAAKLMKIAVTTIPDDIRPKLFDVLDAAKLSPELRYLHNPKKYWGPGSLPRKGAVPGVLEPQPKRALNQNKNTKKRKREQLAQEEAEDQIDVTSVDDQVPSVRFHSGGSGEGFDVHTNNTVPLHSNQA